MPAPTELLRHLISHMRLSLMEKLAPALYDDPHYAADALALMARGLLWQRRNEEAVALARRAIAANPEHWLANILAYQSLVKLGRKDEAATYLATVMAQTPSQAAIDQLYQQMLRPDTPFAPAMQAFFSHAQARGMRLPLVDAPLSTLRDWATAHGVPITEFGEPEAVPYGDTNDWPPHGERKLVHIATDTPFVADLQNVRIFSKSSIILTEDGTALHEAGAHPRFGHTVDFARDPAVLLQASGRVLMNPAGYESVEVEAAIFLSGQSADAFGHWIPEFLPKLQILEQHPAFADRPIIVDAQMPDSHFTLLERIVKNPLLKLPPGGSFFCRRLLVSPVPYFLPTDILPSHFLPEGTLIWSPRGLRYVRERTRSPALPRSKFGERIFLGRKNMGGRYLMNEAEIGHDLETLGFQTVYIERLSVDEQQALFREARWVVGPIGAALQNLIFSEPSTKLLVLSHEKARILGCLQGPMEALGYDLTFVRGETTDGSDRQHADFSVPVSKIRGALAAMGLPEAQAKP